MPESNYKTIEKRLLKGGVAWKHVRRTIRELHHHYLDLVAKAEADGEFPDDTEMLAKQRLGTEDQIVREVLSRPELKSLAHRVPWLILWRGTSSSVCSNARVDHCTAGDRFEHCRTVVLPRRCHQRNERALNSIYCRTLHGHDHSPPGHRHRR